MPPWWVPLALVLVLWLCDAPTWRGYRERIQPSVQDRRTLQINNALGLSAVVLGFASLALLSGDARFALPRLLAWAGVAVALAGSALRLWAILTLGRWFTLTIQVHPQQPVVDAGPYRVLRHPSYLGGEIALFGAGLACGNWVSPLVFAVPWVVAHVVRIRVEEAALLQTLGEPYARYRERTWRLVPFVW